MIVMLAVHVVAVARLVPAMVFMPVMLAMVFVFAVPAMAFMPAMFAVPATAIMPVMPTVAFMTS